MAVVIDDTMINMRTSNSNDDINITNVVLKAAVTDEKLLCVCHFNSQSLHTKRFNKIDEIRNIFQATKFHIIGVSETWLKPYVSNKLVDISGYKIFRNDRLQSRSGGVAIYVKREIKAFVVAKSVEKSMLTVGQLDRLDKIEYPTEGIQFLFIEVHTLNQKFLYGVVYNPKSIKFSNRNNLSPMFSELLNKYEDIVIFGDFNTNLLESKPHINDFNDFINEHGLSNFSREPTHFTSTSATLLDLLLVNHLDKVMIFNQIDVPGISKHDLIYATYDIKMEKNRTKSYSFRDYNALNVDSIFRTIAATSWFEFYNLAESEQMLIFLNNLLIQLFNSHVPIKVKVFKDDQNPPWFNDSIMVAMRNRNICYRSWVRFRDSETFALYKRHRNKVNHLVKAAKRTYMNRYLGADIPTKILWDRIRNLGIRSKDCADIPFSPDNLLDSFTADSTQHTLIPASSSTVPNTETPQFSFRNVDIDTVYKSIMSIKSNAVGMDGIPMKFIKIVLPFIIYPITHFYNYVITSSTFPDSWKHGKIIPIPKKSNVKTVKDVRPITILPALSKALERIVSDQIIEHLEENKLLSPFQSGFRKRHSTETAILKVTDDIISSLDKRLVAILVLLDFSKAFDLVDHSILLSKLSMNFLFSNSAVKLISTYLHNRSQIVQLGDITSKSNPVKSGVPQGSIIGPLLFCLFINDLPNVVKFSSIHLYADDVQIYHNGNNRAISKLVNEINIDLRNVCDWASMNGLVLNVEKTLAILFSLTNNETYQQTAPRICIGDQVINYSSKVRNLGVIMDTNLNWMEHINSICQKTYGCLRQLWSSFSITPLTVRKKLFSSLILPHFSYCGTVLGRISEGGIQKLRRALNSCARYVYGIGRFESISRYTKDIMGGFEIKMFYSSLSCKLIHKLLTFRCPEYLSRKLVFGTSTRSVQLTIPRNSTDLKNRSFFVYGLRLYNNLPNNLKNKSAASFKRDCNTYFSSSQN